MADPLAETTLASETVYEGRIVDVRIDEVQTADGRRFRREVVVHPGAVAAVPLTSDGEVVLVRQWRQPAGKVLLEIPAGKLETGEEPEACVQRELAEETGLVAGRLGKLSALYLAPGYSSELIHIYLATELSPASGEQDADEHVEAQRLPLAEARARCLRGEIEDAKTVAGILAASARRP